MSCSGIHASEANTKLLFNIWYCKFLKFRHFGGYVEIFLCDFNSCILDDKILSTFFDEINGVYRSSFVKCEVFNTFFFLIIRLIVFLVLNHRSYVSFWKFYSFNFWSQINFYFLWDRVWSSHPFPYGHLAVTASIVDIFPIELLSTLHLKSIKHINSHLFLSIKCYIKWIFKNFVFQVIVTSTQKYIFYNNLISIKLAKFTFQDL